MQTPNLDSVEETEKSVEGWPINPSAVTKIITPGKLVLAKIDGKEHYIRKLQTHVDFIENPGQEVLPQVWDGIKGMSILEKMKNSLSELKNTLPIIDFQILAVGGKMYGSGELLQNSSLFVVADKLGEDWSELLYIGDDDTLEDAVLKYTEIAFGHLEDFFDEKQERLFFDAILPKQFSYNMKTETIVIFDIDTVFLHYDSKVNVEVFSEYYNSDFFSESKYLISKVSDIDVREILLNRLDNIKQKYDNWLSGKVLHL